MEREREVKRQTIIDERNLKVSDLAGRAEQCAKIREMAKEESEVRREKLQRRKAEEEKGKQMVREASVLRAGQDREEEAGAARGGAPPRAGAEGDLDEAPVPRRQRGDGGDQGVR